jgi:uncharacterized membrane protein
MKMIAGLFDTYQDAERAVNELQHLGITREQISVVARDAVLQERVVGTEDAEAEGAGAGAIGGTAVGGLGGLLVGLSAITIPGLGPVITAGTLITAIGTTLAGAGIGAAAGGLIGALTGAGIPEEDAQIYAESVRRGGILVTAEIDDGMSTAALEALERANAVDVAARREEFRRGGWERFDESSNPAPDDIRYGGIRTPR